MLGHRLTSWNKDVSRNLSVYIMTAIGCVSAKSQHNSEVELKPWRDHLCNGAAICVWITLFCLTKRNWEASPQRCSWAGSPPLWDASCKKKNRRKESWEWVDWRSQVNSHLPRPLKFIAGSEIKPLKKGIWNVANELTSVCIVGLWYWSCMVPS